MRTYLNTADLPDTEGPGLNVLGILQDVSSAFAGAVAMGGTAIWLAYLVG